MPESLLIVWLLQENDDGQWAVFVHAGDGTLQVSAWFPERNQALHALLTPSSWGEVEP